MYQLHLLVMTIANDLPFSSFPLFRYYTGSLEATASDDETLGLIETATKGLIRSIEDGGIDSVMEWEVDEVLNWTNTLNFDE